MVSDESCLMYVAELGKMWLISWRVVGNLREICKCWMICAVVWAGEWLDEFWRVGELGKVALLLGKGVEGICNRVMGMWEIA